MSTSSASDRNEGVSPLFAPVLEALLDAPLVMQTRHLAQRGGLTTKCGSYEGQTTTHASEVTCAACKAPKSKVRATCSECNAPVDAERAGRVSDAGFPRHKSKCRDCTPGDIQDAIDGFYRRGAP